MRTALCAKLCFPQGFRLEQAETSLVNAYKAPGQTVSGVRMFRRMRTAVVVGIRRLFRGPERAMEANSVVKLPARTAQAAAMHGGICYCASSNWSSLGHTTLIFLVSTLRQARRASEHPVLPYLESPVSARRSRCSACLSVAAVLGKCLASLVMDRSADRKTSRPQRPQS